MSHEYKEGLIMDKCCECSASFNDVEPGTVLKKNGCPDRVVCSACCTSIIGNMIKEGLKIDAAEMYREVSPWRVF